MRQVVIGLAVGCILASVGCSDSTTLTSETDATVALDTTVTDDSTTTDAQSSSDTAVSDPCDPNPCLNDAACSANSDGVAECACPDGWEGELCDTDIDECAASDNPCGANGTCTNTDGGFDCVCNDGWIADENGACVDVDECASEEPLCGENEVCTNTEGSYECGCADGYAAGDDDGACIDVDECAAEESPCDPNATCANTDGGYECTCNEGWTATDDGTCADIDECADAFPPCGENANCTNTDGAYECACKEGYTGDGLDCADVDECAATEPISEDFNAVDDDGNPIVPEGWSMFGSDMLEVDKEDPVLWHINADGQLQYSNKEGTNYNGETIGAAALPSMEIAEGDMLYASVSIQQEDDQFNPEYDLAWIGFLSCSTDVDFAGCLTAHQEGAVDENEELIATLVPLWSKDDYNDFIGEADLEPGALIDVSLDLSPAAGWTGWVHFAFDSVDWTGNDGSGFIVDNVSVTKTAQVCGVNEGCENTEGAFECSCLEGFEADLDGVCTDIDECLGEVCSENEDCTNTPGGFECPCSAGYGANEEGVCADVDECELGSSECDVNASCKNTVGNYVCACNDGFTGDGISCTNIDECAEGIDECGENSTCSNGKAGGVVCQGDSCDVQACQDAVGDVDFWCFWNWDETCAACATGKKGFEGLDCSSIGNACVEAPYTCDCADGYALNEDGLTCSDVDECVGDDPPCDAAATCTNTVGGYTCTCNAGYEGDGISCENLDECAEDLDMCGPNTTCDDFAPGPVCQGNSCENEGCIAAVNALDDWCDIGSWDLFCAACAASGTGYEGLDCSSVGAACLSDVKYTCPCNDGYAANDDGLSCSDINECLDDNGGCDQMCSNSDGSYSCSCTAGYTLADNGVSCYDIDECQDNNGGCDQLCKNEVGSFTCDCEPGYAFDADGVTCNEIDECSPNPCLNGGTCTDGINAFTCTCQLPYFGEVCEEQAEPGSETFNYTGDAQKFVVPEGVAQLTIQAFGAEGGTPFNSLIDCAGLPDKGGSGGLSKGILKVTPGETLYIYVGGKGGQGDSGGFNGGAGSCADTFNCSGGGGASDVRQGGNALSDRVIVAGGGGGAEYSCGGAGGGSGGGKDGGDASGGDSANGDGKGGTQSTGGAGGINGEDSGAPGSFGAGGAGSATGDHAGGGGGGWYGGGGGARDGHAGGGSGYIGGVEDGSTISGVQTGDGSVTLSW